MLAFWIPAKRQLLAEDLATASESVHNLSLDDAPRETQQAARLELEDLRSALTPYDWAVNIELFLLVLGFGGLMLARRNDHLAMVDQMLTVRAYSHELEDSNMRLQDLAAYDELTGLLNRRAFDARLHAAFARYERTLEPVSLLILDIDNFKDLNDEFGHATGDNALRQIGGLLRSKARPYDPVSRYGGEEFAILLENVGSDEAFCIAERLRAEVASEGWSTVKMTVSVGVASSAGRIIDLDCLMTEADNALYDSKRRGRNRTTFARPRVGVD